MTEAQEIETTTQEPETDWKAEAERLKAESRKWEARSKENKEKADRLDELMAASMSEAEKAKAAEERAKSAEEAAEKATREVERLNLVAKVSEETKVPGSLLQGTSEDELRASAKAVVDFAASTAPGVPQDKGGASAKPAITRDSIEAIEDPIARINARAQNISLYQ